MGPYPGTHCLADHIFILEDGDSRTPSRAHHIKACPLSSEAEETAPPPAALSSPLSSEANAATGAPPPSPAAATGLRQEKHLPGHGAVGSLVRTSLLLAVVLSILGLLLLLTFGPLLPTVRILLIVRWLLLHITVGLLILLVLRLLLLAVRRLSSDAALAQSSSGVPSLKAGSSSPAVSSSSSSGVSHRRVVVFTS